MAGQKTISPQQLEQFRKQLREMQDNLLDQVDQGMEAIREEMNPAGDLSNAPVHLADAASDQLDVDITVTENEGNLLQEVRSALHRIDEGHFGKCTACGTSISLQRLEVIPHTPFCITCASKAQTQGAAAATAPHSRSMLRLTGFEAIEFAEKEGYRLNKAGDSIDDAAHGLSVAEAEAIASDNPELIWLEIPAEAYGVRKNMRPGR
jgi:DnaK suppressor protein